MANFLGEAHAFPLRTTEYDSLDAAVGLGLGWVNAWRVLRSLTNEISRASLVVLRTLTSSTHIQNVMFVRGDSIVPNIGRSVDLTYKRHVPRVTRLAPLKTLRDEIRRSQNGSVQGDIYERLRHNMRTPEPGSGKCNGALGRHRLLCESQSSAHHLPQIRPTNIGSLLRVWRRQI